MFTWLTALCKIDNRTPDRPTFVRLRPRDCGCGAHPRAPAMLYVHWTTHRGYTVHVMCGQTPDGTSGRVGQAVGVHLYNPPSPLLPALAARMPPLRRLGGSASFTYMTQPSCRMRAAMRAMLPARDGAARARGESTRYAACRTCARPP